MLLQKPPYRQCAELSPSQASIPLSASRRSPVQVGANAADGSQEAAFRAAHSCSASGMMSSGMDVLPACLPTHALHAQIKGSYLVEFLSDGVRAQARS